jgi:site-specific DNA recombinase
VQKPRHTFAYCRVSGDEQARHGTSLAAQAEEIRRWCELRSFPQPKVFSEVASGSRERLDDRIQLARLLVEVGPGDLVVVSKVDRWSRDLVHAVDSIRKLVRSGVLFFAIGESCDPTTPQGDQMLGIMAWAADAERQRIKERTVGTRHRLRDTGHWAEGSPPYGFRVKGRRLVVEPREAKALRRVFEFALTHPMRATVEYAKKLDPDHAWDRSNLHKALRKRWYLGEIRTTTGRWIKAHDPIVDADLFARVSEALVSRRHGGPTPRTPRTAGWLLRGIAHCAVCGSKMGSAYSTNNGYYACARRLYAEKKGDRCDAGYVFVPKTDEAAASMTLERLRELQSELAKKPKKSEPIPTGEAEVAKLRKQRERLIDLAADGRISAGDLTSRMDRIDDRLRQLEIERADLERRQKAANSEKRAELLSEMVELERLWRRAAVPRKRDILARLAERIDLSVDGPRICWRGVAALVL